MNVTQISIKVQRESMRSICNSRDKKKRSKNTSQENIGRNSS